MKFQGNNYQRLIRNRV